MAGKTIHIIKSASSSKANANQMDKPNDYSGISFQAPSRKKRDSLIGNKRKRDELENNNNNNELALYDQFSFNNQFEDEHDAFEFDPKKSSPRKRQKSLDFYGQHSFSFLEHPQFGNDELNQNLWLDVPPLEPIDGNPYANIGRPDGAFNPNVIRPQWNASPIDPKKVHDQAFVEDMQWKDGDEDKDMRLERPRDKDSQKVANAKQYVHELISKVADTDELKENLQQDSLLNTPLKDLNELSLQDIGTPRACVYGKINPTFHIDIPNLEMRGEASGGTAKAQWQGGNLKLDKLTPEYIVGIKMHATNLNLDTMPGSSASADTEQDPWMQKMPGLSQERGNFSGGENKYIRGHLLNDNLGGPARQLNLFPITDYANGQHKNNAEQYIKKGAERGYSFEYKVNINNINEGHTIKGSTTYYTVDCDLDYHFGRLAAGGVIAPGTEHKGRIQSRFQEKKFALFWDGTNWSALDKNDVYKTDYTDGKASKPKDIGLQGPTGHLASPNTVNDANDFNETANLLNSHNFLDPNFDYDFAPVAPPQLINLNASTGQKLSLRQTTDISKIVTRFDGNNNGPGLVDGWAKTDIESWIDDVRTNASTGWAAVIDEATANNLDVTVADELFGSGGSLGRKNVTVNGKEY